MELSNWFPNMARYIYAFLNFGSLCIFLKWQNRKIIVVFRVNFCFLILSFWGLLIYLFLICFFRLLIILNNADYQWIIINQQDFKNKMLDRLSFIYFKRETTQTRNYKRFFSSLPAPVPLYLLRLALKLYVTCKETLRV